MSGANVCTVTRYVMRNPGEGIDLRYNKRADALQYGWIVEQHPIAGEWGVSDYDHFQP